MNCCLVGCKKWPVGRQRPSFQTNWQKTNWPVMVELWSDTFFIITERCKSHGACVFLRWNDNLYWFIDNWVKRKPCSFWANEEVLWIVAGIRKMHFNYKLMPCGLAKQLFIQMTRIFSSLVLISKLLLSCVCVPRHFEDGAIHGFPP